MLSKNFIYSAIILMTSILYFMQCKEFPPKFCEQNYIDSVLTNGFNYRIIRDKWIADYNEEENYVTEFKYFKEYSEHKPIQRSNSSEEYSLITQFADNIEYYFVSFEYKPIDSTLLIVLIDSKYNKTLINISGAQNLIIISCFSWNNTQNIHLVIESRDDLFNGFIYIFDPKDSRKPFIWTGQKVIEFFGCKSNEVEKEVIDWSEAIAISLIVILITTYLLLFVLIIFVCI